MEYLFNTFYIMVGVFITYLTFIITKYGVQKSISDSYYRLPSKFNYLFTLFCWGFSLPAIIIGVTLTDGPLMFLAGTGIAFVGTAAAFKQKLTRTVHTVGAIAGVFFSQLSIIINFNMWEISIISLILGGVIFFKNIPNKIWWGEIVAFTAIGVVYYIELFI